jgi:hypothetical protein
MCDSENNEKEITRSLSLLTARHYTNGIAAIHCEIDHKKGEEKNALFFCSNSVSSEIFKFGFPSGLFSFEMLKDVGRIVRLLVPFFNWPVTRSFIAHGFMLRDVVIIEKIVVLP